MIFGKTGAIAGAIVLVAVWPFAIGQIAQTMYEKEMAKIKSPYLTYETVSYKQGYLSSEILTRVVIKESIKLEQEWAGFPREFMLLSHVKHEILGVSSTSMVQMTPETTKFAEKIWGSPGSPVSLKTDVALFGDFKFDFSLEPIDFIENLISVTSSPLSVSGEMNRGGEIFFDMKMPLFAMNEANGESLLIKDFMGHGRGEMREGFWLGEQSFSVSTFGFDDAQKMKITVSDFALETSNSLKEKKETHQDMDSRSLFSFEKMNFSDAFVLDKFKMGLNLQKMDFPSLIALLQWSKTSPENNAENKQAGMMRMLRQFFEKGFNFNIEPFEVNTREGHINARLDLSIHPHMTKNSQDLTSNLDGNLWVDLPAKYVEGIPSVSAAFKVLALSGFVSEAENGVTLSAKIEKGNAISSSGVKIPLSLFVEGLM